MSFPSFSFQGSQRNAMTIVSSTVFNNSCLLWIARILFVFVGTTAVIIVGSLSLLTVAVHRHTIDWQQFGYMLSYVYHWPLLLADLYMEHSLLASWWITAINAVDTTKSRIHGWVDSKFSQVKDHVTNTKAVVKTWIGNLLFWRTEDGLYRVVKPPQVDEANALHTMLRQENSRRRSCANCRSKNDE